MPFDIRFATPTDITEIARIFRVTRECNLSYLPQLHTPEEDLNYFRNHVFQENTIMVAVDNGKLMGYCAFKEGWVDHLYLLPEHQRKGVGTMLLDKVKATYPKLQLWVFQKNTNARGFYEKNGFTLVEETDGENNMEKEPDTLYEWSRKSQG